MQDLKIPPHGDPNSLVVAPREPYVSPTVTVVPLKIEERLLACPKLRRRSGCSARNTS